MHISQVPSSPFQKSISKVHAAQTTKSIQDSTQHLNLSVSTLRSKGNRTLYKRRANCTLVSVTLCPIHQKQHPRFARHCLSTRTTSTHMHGPLQLQETIQGLLPHRHFIALYTFTLCCETFALPLVAVLDVTPSLTDPCR